MELNSTPNFIFLFYFLFIFNHENQLAYLTSLTHFQTHDFIHPFSLKQLCQDENNLGQYSVVPEAWLGRTGAVLSKAVPGPLPTFLS